MLIIIKLRFDFLEVNYQLCGVWIKSLKSLYIVLFDIFLNLFVREGFKPPLHLKDFIDCFARG